MFTLGFFTGLTGILSLIAIPAKFIFLILALAG